MWRSCAMRLMLDVPIVAPAGSSSIEHTFSDATKASATACRFGMAAITSSAVAAVGRSLRLCTARSAVPSKIAFSTSDVKNPTDSDL